MGRLAVGVAIASLTLVTACGGEAEETAESATSEVSEAVESAGEEAGEAVGGGTTLTGRVGTEDDPDAFEISLVDEAGEPVTSLPAGDYTIEVNDSSAIHNFHLVGGSVDESTAVPEEAETTFEVTLEAGEYTYKCDPHPPMTGSFTVT